MYWRKRIEDATFGSPGRTTKSSHLVSDGLDLSVDGTGFVAVGSYTSMSKGQAMAGNSTSHTSGMAGRG